MRKLSAVLGAVIAVSMVVSTAHAKDFPGTMGKIQKSGTITLGVRETSAPFSYLNAEHKPVGYSNELCLKVAEEVKSELKLPKLRVRYVTVTPETRIPLLVNGTIDIECGVLTNTLPRHHQVSFSPTIFLAGGRILAPKGSDIKSVKDLSGKSVAVVENTIESNTLRRIIEKDHISNVKLLFVANDPEALLALQGGRVDAFVSSDVQLFTELAQRPELKKHFAVVGPYLYFSPIALMIPRGDPDFAFATDAALVKLFRSGEILKIYDKWFGPIGMPASAALKEAFKIQALPE